MLTLDAAKMITHSILSYRGWTTPMHYCTARLPPTSTSCKWHRTQWLHGDGGVVCQAPRSVSATVHGVTQTTIHWLPTNNIQHSSPYIWNENHCHSCLPLSPDSSKSSLPTRTDTTIRWQPVTVCTEEGTKAHSRTSTGCSHWAAARL